MDSCKLCGTALDSSADRTRGLCMGCGMAVDIDIIETWRIMLHCEHVISTSTRHQVRLYHCLLLIQKAKWLNRYERMDIPTITPPPSIWIDRYHDRYDEIVMERIFAEVDDALAGAETSASPRALDAHINAMLLRIDNGKKLFLNKARSETLNARVMNYLYNNLLTLAV